MFYLNFLTTQGQSAGSQGSSPLLTFINAVAIAIGLIIFIKWRRKKNLEDSQKTDKYDQLIEGKYYDNKRDNKTTEQLIADVNAKKSLRRAERTFLSAMHNLDHTILTIEEELEDPDLEEEYDLNYTELQVLYEKRSLAMHYYEKYDKNFFAREWLLNRVFNDGEFITKNEAKKIDAEIEDLILESDPAYQKRVDIAETVSTIIAFIPFIIFILSVLMFICLSGDFLRMFVISWISILPCWVILPPILERIIIGRKISQNTRKKFQKQHLFKGGVLAAMSITTASKLKKVGKPNIRDDI